MGKGDRRHSQKALQRKGQRKLKARIKKAAGERQARFAASTKATEKKRPARRSPAAASSGGEGA